MGGGGGGGGGNMCFQRPPVSSEKTVGLFYIFQNLGGAQPLGPLRSVTGYVRCTNHRKYVVSVLLNNTF